MSDDAVLELPGDNSLELRFFRGTFSLSVTNDWAGDTETGFGAHCARDLSEAEAIQLAEFILARTGRLATLETALRTIQSAVPKYLKKEMTAEEFALVVIGETDSAKVNKALEGKK